MRSTIRHGGKITCETAGCGASFTSYSLVSLIRGQAIHAGWGRVSLNMLEGWRNLQLGSNGTRKLDMCPQHGDAIKASFAVRSKDEKRLKEEARAAAKAARVKEKADARKARMAKRSERIEAKHAKREAREARKVARVAAKVAKDAAKAAKAARISHAEPSFHGGIEDEPGFAPEPSFHGGIEDEPGFAPTLHLVNAS